MAIFRLVMLLCCRADVLSLWLELHLELKRTLLSTVRARGDIASLGDTNVADVEWLGIDIVFHTGVSIK